MEQVGLSINKKVVPATNVAILSAAAQGIPNIEVKAILDTGDSATIADANNGLALQEMSADSFNNQLVRRIEDAIKMVAVKVAKELNFTEDQKEKLMKLLPKVNIFLGNEFNSDNLTASYSGETHNIKANPKYISDSSSFFTPEMVAFHEGNHAIESILRSCLTETELNNAFKESILDEVLNGSAFKLFTGVGLVEQAFIPSKELRNELKNYVSNLLDGLDESNPLMQKKQIVYLNKSPDLYQLSQEGINGLDKCMQKSDSHYKEFLSYFGGDKEKALAYLKQYVDVQLIRYQALTNENVPKFVSPTIPKKLIDEVGLELTDSQKAFAIKSAKEFIHTGEGNLKYQVIMKNVGSLNKDAALSYAFAPEEVRCQRIGIDLTLEQKPPDEKREQMGIIRDVYKKGEELVEYRKKLLQSHFDKEKQTSFFEYLTSQDELLKADKKLMATLQVAMQGIDFSKHPDLVELGTETDGAMTGFLKQCVTGTDEKLQEIIKGIKITFGQFAEKVCSIDENKKSNLKEAEQYLTECLELRLKMTPLIKEAIKGSYDPINLLDMSVKENAELKQNILDCEKWLIENVDRVNLPFLASAYFKMPL